MKATGIIRRIDDLGRVVIPKEIRRQMKIREGDPLEIYTDSDGTVCFRKYSPIGAIDTDTIKRVCIGGLGIGNYTVFDRDGEPIVPNSSKTLLDVDEPLDEKTVPIYCDGDIIGYLRSTNSNRTFVAKIIGELFAD